MWVEGKTEDLSKFTDPCKCYIIQLGQNNVCAFHPLYTQVSSPWKLQFNKYAQKQTSILSSRQTLAVKICNNNHPPFFSPFLPCLLFPSFQSKVYSANIYWTPNILCITTARQILSEQRLIYILFSHPKNCQKLDKLGMKTQSPVCRLGRPGTCQL